MMNCINCGAEITENQKKRFDHLCPDCVKWNWFWLKLFIVILISNINVSILSFILPRIIA